MDSILAMFTAVIMSSLFDLVDHYTHTLLLQKKSDLSLWGWLIPLNDFLTTLLIGILVVKIIRPRISWLMTSLSRPTWLWRITAILFMLYIWLTAIMEKNGIANRYASMLLIVYFIIIIVSAIGFIDFMRTSKRAQQQQQIIDKYQAQITNANQMNQQYNEIRRERHDLRNMLLSIQGYIRDHKDKEAEKLLSTFLQNDTTEKHYDEVDLALDKIKISGLHNLIKEKAYKIVEKGIPFSFEVNAEIDKLPGSEIKTARIIGILMDNAIEATFKQTKPYIQFALLKHSPKVYELVIANSIEQKLNINTALKFEHSTKEGHQGIGLSNVTQLVENDDHYSFSAEVKDKVVMMTCFIQRK
ncbi:GHKL domain-containing protein [Limosilactobacillus reuteri]|uniref:GHKL domain-containing protein n=1 Tax=Limosilactobacillus reuteri TaxID=1598 RepID=UPI001E4E0709|nr:GHKL domain-containing protein [Limosilactobacillus reuteri]MCC4326603.1 GHKL domain-containing protein [Limosilactobacillus reuteri]MCC4330574.1 GHKL domain-containing protein [Limosilactobacillus reuteri]MCC4353021.1 GHKL domain-containing protein [Limosilactobacillus reuteri]MCC4377585.1 GHKL domain-containing protein [Limosilactobacillus reuteri]